MADGTAVVSASLGPNVALQVVEAPNASYVLARIPFNTTVTGELEVTVTGDTGVITSAASYVNAFLSVRCIICVMHGFVCLPIYTTLLICD